jgi:hypothetical protein
MKSSQSISRKKITWMGLGKIAIWLACAIVGCALLPSGSATAQTVICDSDFSPNIWALQVFSCPAGNNVTATQQSTGGSLQPPAICPLNSNYRDVSNILIMQGTGGPNCPSESIVYGVHIFNGTNGTYSPSISGAVASISFQIDYQCPDSVASAQCPPQGQAFGPALLQGGKYFVANVPTNITVSLLLGRGFLPFPFRQVLSTKSPKQGADQPKSSILPAALRTSPLQPRQFSAAFTRIMPRLGAAIRSRRDTTIGLVPSRRWASSRSARWQAPA